MSKFQDSETHCRLLLDLTFASNLLSSKIADIPHKHKYETIIKPIFEYCFGMSDDRVWEYENSFEGKVNINDEVIYKIDWIRDGTFIKDQIFDLVSEKFIILATKIGLFNDRSFVLDIFQYFPDIDVLSHVKDAFKKDREIVLAAVTEWGTNLKYACADLQNDFEIVKAAVIDSGYALEYASYALKDNKEIVKLAIRNNGSCIQYASQELRNDIELVTLAVQDDGFALRYASEELKNNKEIVLIALESYPRAYSCVPYPLREDREVIVKSFSKSLNHITELGDQFKTDRDLIKLFTKIDGYNALWYASKELRNDRELVIQAIQQDAHALVYASDAMKNDREIIKLAVMKDGTSLEYAAMKFRDDNEIVELALKSSLSVLDFISGRLRKDDEFLFQALGKRLCFSIPIACISDKEILLEMIKLDQENLESISNELRLDREFIYHVVKNCGMALEYVSDEFKQDREIVLAAVSQDANAILFASNFTDDSEIILKAVEKSSPYLNSVIISERLRNDREIISQFAKKGFFDLFPRKYLLDREILLETLESGIGYNSLSSVSYKAMTMDRVFAIRLVKKNGLLLGDLCSRHRNDREIVTSAVKQNKKALKFASIELANDKEIMALCNY